MISNKPYCKQNINSTMNENLYFVYNKNNPKSLVILKHPQFILQSNNGKDI